MAKSTKTKTAAVSRAEERVRMLAYLNWERETGGNPVDEDTSRRFWLEAERQVAETPEQAQQ